MAERRRQQGGLVVHFMGRRIAELCPRNPPFTFGRGSDRTLRFGHDTVNGGPDLDISRNAGSIHHDNGLWVLCNDSTNRPFDVIVGNVPHPRPARPSPDHPASPWAISPPGLKVRVYGASGRFLLEVKVDDPWSRVVDSPTSSDPLTAPQRLLPERERLMLAAKFLALPAPGDAVGNLEAAKYASAARPHEKPVTDKAIEACVARACRMLQERGVTGISGRDNINQ